MTEKRKSRRRLALRRGGGRPRAPAEFRPRFSSWSKLQRLWCRWRGTVLRPGSVFFFLVLRVGRSRRRKSEFFFLPLLSPPPMQQQVFPPLSFFPFRMPPVFFRNSSRFACYGPFTIVSSSRRGWSGSKKPRKAPGGSAPPTAKRRKREKPFAAALRRPSNCFCLPFLAFSSLSPYRARVARRPLPQRRRGDVWDPRSADGARRGGDRGRSCCGGSLQRRARLRAQRQHFPMRRSRSSGSLEHPAGAALLPVCRRGVDGVLFVLHVFLSRSYQGRVIERRNSSACFFFALSLPLSLSLVRRRRGNREKAKNEREQRHFFRFLSPSLFALPCSHWRRVDPSVPLFSLR